MSDPDQTNYAGGRDADWQRYSKPITKIGIIGHGEHGKDVFANHLAKHAKLRYIAGTSVYAADIVFHKLRRKFAYAREYPNATACWLDRRNHREDWAEAIGEHNAVDPVQLYRDCLTFQDLLTGLRWRHEFLACREAGLVDLWVFVHREGQPSDDTCEIRPGDCDWQIPNNGTLDELEAHAKWLAKWIEATNHQTTTATLHATPDRPMT